MKKEIDRDIVKFNLERLKGKEIVVNCVTEEQFQNFINWGYSLNYFNSERNFWEEYKEDSCLKLSSDLTWTYGRIEWFENEGSEIISYEEALLKESKKQKKSKKIKQKFPCLVSIHNGGEIVSCPHKRWFLEVLKPKGFELATKDEVESYYYLGKD